MQRDIDHRLFKRTATLVSAAAEANVSLITVESCTAGRLVSLLAEGPKASSTVAGGFVTYTKSQKVALGVSKNVLKRDGAVSEAVASLMAECGLNHSSADIAIALTGVAGPDPDEDENPVGLLFIAVHRRGEPGYVRKFDYGEIDREVFMHKALLDALELLFEAITSCRT